MTSPDSDSDSEPGHGTCLGQLTRADSDSEPGHWQYRDWPIVDSESLYSEPIVRPGENRLCQ